MSSCGTVISENKFAPQPQCVPEFSDCGSQFSISSLEHMLERESEEYDACDEYESNVPDDRFLLLPGGVMYFGTAVCDSSQSSNSSLESMLETGSQEYDASDNNESRFSDMSEIYPLRTETEENEVKVGGNHQDTDIIPLRTETEENEVKVGGNHQDTDIIPFRTETEENEVKVGGNHQDTDIMEVAFRRNYFVPLSELGKRKASLSRSECEFENKLYVWRYKPYTKCCMLIRDSDVGVAVGCGHQKHEKCCPEGIHPIGSVFRHQFIGTQGLVYDAYHEVSYEDGDKSKPPGNSILIIGYEACDNRSLLTKGELQSLEDGDCF